MATDGTNYIEHYGLLRQKEPNGKYERCQPYHSWNSNHKYTNLVLFHLERHSDHRAIRLGAISSCDFKDVPRLPSGYNGMFPLAYVPLLVSGNGPETNGSLTEM